MSDSQWHEAIAYARKMKDIILLNIVLCKILIMKNCVAGVLIYGYPIPELSLWELMWAIITLIWHFFGKFAMTNMSRKKIKIYIYANSCVTLAPILIAGIKSLSEIQTSWNDLLEYEPENVPMLIFWFLFFSISVAAQVEFHHCGHSFLQLTDRLFY